jgi:hypothetical protein
MKTRKQPAGLARAREQRKRAELDERAVRALERIAEAVEGIPGRFAIVVQRAVPIRERRSTDATS